MKRVAFGLMVMIVAAVSRGAVFERYLSPERPLDRAILGYLELDRSGKATSTDLANLGVLLLQKGFPVDAERYLRKALAADKHNFEAEYRLGLVLQRQGHDHEAIKFYKRTLKERPGHGYARFMLAMAEERCGERTAAIQDYAKAYRFAPDLADPRSNPLVLDSDLQTEAALKRYQQTRLSSTLKVTPVDPEAVKRMMEARPQPSEAPEAPGQPVTGAPPAPVQTAPTPTAPPTPPPIKPAPPTPPVSAPAAGPTATPRPGPGLGVVPGGPRFGPRQPIVPPTPTPPSTS